MVKIKHKILVYLNNFLIDEYLPKPEIPKRDLKWENDLELRSKFIDRRVSHLLNTTPNSLIFQEELIDDYKSYIYHHPDITALASDFLQSVLIMKPENILEYATEFFAPYNLQTADRSLFRFADEKIPVPKPNISLE
jgi:hypothetical protein